MGNNKVVNNTIMLYLMSVANKFKKIFGRKTNE